jgi:hypothetical protein
MSSAPTDIATEALKVAHAPAVTTSWDEVNLEPILDGEQVEEGPTMLRRTDGAPLLTAGRVQAFNGEPGVGKGWLAAAACVEQISARRHVVYIDFEDRPEAIVARLLALGVDAAETAHFFHYVRPDEPLEGRAHGALRSLLGRTSPALVVIDGVTEAMTLHDLDLRDNADVAKFQALLARPIAVAGPGVVLLDHVTKSVEARGRFALGAGHKLAGVDVAFSLELIRPFGRGRSGLAKLTVTKDRPGFVHGLALGGKVAAEFHMSANHDGSSVEAELRPPVGGDFRPTVLMERVSRHLERTPGEPAQRDVLAAVKGNRDHLIAAIRCLVEEGFVEERPDGNALRYRSKRPFRDGNDQ